MLTSLIHNSPILVKPLFHFVGNLGIRMQVAQVDTDDLETGDVVDGAEAYDLLA